MSNISKTKRPLTRNQRMLKDYVKDKYGHYGATLPSSIVNVRKKYLKKF